MPPISGLDSLLYI